MPIVPGQDPNEAYDVIPMPEYPRGPRGVWWTATCNGIPVQHFAPERRDIAERHATDPEYRLSRISKKLHDR
jgi:hypothetical protein